MKKLVYFHFTPGRLIRPCMSGLIALCLGLALLCPALQGCASRKETATGTAHTRETGQATERGPTWHVQKGSTSVKKGAFEKAIPEWEKALKLYEEASDRQGRVDILVKLSQAYQSIGQLGDALKRLEEALEISRKMQDPSVQALVYGHLGNVYLGLGDLEKAEMYLNKGLSGAEETGDPGLEATFSNNMGNLHTSKKEYDAALKAYSRSIELAGRINNPQLASVAGVNSGMTLIRKGALREAWELFDRTRGILREAEPGYYKAFGLINLGLGYRELGGHLPNQRLHLLTKAFECLSRALEIAGENRDHRTASYAFGYLGSLYEGEHRYQEALDLTRRAVFAAQQIHAPESLYRWHWQTGRIFNARGRMDEAISAFKNALYSLQEIREEMSGCYANPEASFRDVAGSICFDLVDLLLRKASSTGDKEDAGTYLIEARETVELLKAYELRDYFRDDCVDAFSYSTVGLDEISKTAVVVYPILLEDRMEVLVTLPSGLKQVTVPVDRGTIRREAMELRRTLVKRTTWEFLPHAQKIYSWLIGPIETELRDLDIDTLVFVPDGPLRTIPMASLHDGTSFLIENYALAITPGLDLTEPRSISHEEIRVLALGLTKPVQGFGSLPYVTEEMDALDLLFECTSLLNQEFCIPNLEEALQERQFNVVHIASHGQFGGELSDTFLLAFDDKVTMDHLSSLIGLFRFRDKPLDLLTLSACETAAGDDRAALGLAGIAVKAGARSALATLWHINDQATSILISDFYDALKSPSSTRASALRHAQLRLLRDPRYEHPGYWSAFLMINNWL